jgi:hypothetical protein
MKVGQRNLPPRDQGVNAIITRKAYRYRIEKFTSEFFALTGESDRLFATAPAYPTMPFFAA